MDICIALAATSLVLARLASPVTLSWRHSVEGTRIEEDYGVAAGRLELAEVRVQGPAAGIEPPPDAQLRDGLWHYRPALPPLERVTLANARPGLEACAGRRCVPLAALALDRPLTLAACR